MMPAELIGLSPRGWVSSWELRGEASGIKHVLIVGKVHGEGSLISSEMLVGIIL